MKKLLKSKKTIYHLRKQIKELKEICKSNNYYSGKGTIIHKGF